MLTCSPRALLPYPRRSLRRRFSSHTLHKYTETLELQGMHKKIRSVGFAGICRVMELCSSVERLLK